MNERMMLALCVFLVAAVVVARARGQDAAISATDKAAVEKLDKVTLVSADTPDKSKGRPQTCHVWISMSDTEPKDQIIVWFEKTPTANDIKSARDAELARRAKDAELRAKLEKEAVK
jgi:uncharacterized ferredoxin-like protein